MLLLRGEFEVGDTQFALKLIPLDNISDDFEAEFELKKQLEAKNIDTKELLSIEFEDFEDGLDVTGKSLEGKTSAIKTFSIVANSVLDFVKENNIKGVVFNSAEANRTRLYKAMVDRFSKELGWEYKQVKTTPVQGEVDTFVVTPKETAKEQPTVESSKKSKQLEEQFAKTPELKPGFSGKKARTSKGEYPSSKTGEVKKYVKIDEKSDDFKVLTKTLNDFLDKHPEYYPYFRYSTTGTRGTTFENIDKFNEYIDKKETKVKIPRKKYHKNNFLNKGLLNNLLKTLESDNKAKLNLLQDIFLDIESFLGSKQGKDKAWVFEQVLLDAQKDQNHFLRILVPFGFYPIDFKSGKPLYDFKATEEHADPAVQVGRQLLTAAINGNVKEAMKVVRATSMQGSLLKLDDDSLKPLDLNSNMPKAYFDIVVRLILEGKLDFLPDGFASLIRYTANNNINPFQYQIAGSSQTIGEFFLGKIDTSNMREFMRKSSTTMEISSIANKLITDVITGKIDIKTAKQRFQSNQKIVPLVVKASKSNNDKSAFKFSKAPTNKQTIETAATTDKALNVARDLDAPIKKIRVFDFDDTLAQTKSDVLYTMPDGTEGKLNAEQFC